MAPLPRAMPRTPPQQSQPDVTVRAPEISRGSVEQAIFTWSTHNLTGGPGQSFGAASPKLADAVSWLAGLDRKRFARLDPTVGVQQDAYADWRSTFLLTLTNPTTVLSFIALLAALGMGNSRHWWLTVFLVAGIFCGSMLWWLVLSSIVNFFRGRFNDRVLLSMNRFAGLLICGFGILAIVLSRT